MARRFAKPGSAQGWRPQRRTQAFLEEWEGKEMQVWQTAATPGHRRREQNKVQRLPKQRDLQMSQDRNLDRSRKPAANELSWAEVVCSEM
ncbi:uncharacterized protein BDZ99DRAFT_460914 [Mytilinidion resinicola]|uniref:Uncharacterized protein n=1 Tax=Mytilinidion resinicola TaxID=574789 RepID=A0A6A6YUC1_9PEZI|nr:uncharacterized protein BDZ99DRAFT_460914 [Mytilinidion resinicola]KAF2812138.1 hypothetical protein BDZ99DRAFT_460914 [Mytilinidion resinicola]